MAAFCAVSLLLGTIVHTNASVEYLLKLPDSLVVENGTVTIPVLFINTGATVERCELPEQMTALLQKQNGESIPVTLKSSQKKEWVELAAGTFKTRSFTFSLQKLDDVTGIALEGCPAVAIRFSSSAPAGVQTTLKSSETTESDYVTGDLGKEDAALEGEGKNKQRSAMVDYFQKHFFGYDPIYFLIGGNPSGGSSNLRGEFPNARFQVSFRYTPIDPEGSWANKWNGLTNIYVSYTQNTEWDLEGDSAPFLDSTFKPELQYYWRNILHEPKGILDRMDILGTISHESNGRAGAGSRSINYIQVRPTFYFGDVNRLNGYLAPGFWVYLGSLSDNPTIRHYRGHADVRAAIQWADTIQLASLFRMGDELEHGFMQLDLSYPLGQLTQDNFDIYLHLQYFTGYGQTLLNYDQREQAIRAGFSFFR